MVLFSIATSTPAEIDWITRGVGVFFPEAYARFHAGAEATGPESIVDAYHRLLMDPKPAIHDKAARDWCDWEDAIVKIRGDEPGNRRYLDPRFRLGFARLVTHYWRHAAWLPDGKLLRDVTRLSAIPGILIHGGLDISSPLATAWQLSKAWADSKLIVIDTAGHGAGREAMADAVRAATDRFAPL
jgi:proline iminopeptidase